MAKNIRTKKIHMENNKQLKHLRDRLEDMEGKWKPFGFGILRPSLAAWVQPAIWELAENVCKPHFNYRDERLHRLSHWLDITPDRTYCIQWWGDEEGVEAFKKWAEDVQVAIRRSPTAAPELFVPSIRPVSPASAYSFGPSSWKPTSGYYWTLNALAMFAIKNPHITLTNEHEVLNTADSKGSVDVQVIPTRSRSLRDDDSHEDPPVIISYMEIEENAITLGLQFIDQFLKDENNNHPQEETKDENNNHPQEETDSIPVCHEITFDLGDESYILKSKTGSYPVPKDFKDLFGYFAQKVHAESPGEPIDWIMIHKAVHVKITREKVAENEVRRIMHEINKEMLEKLGRTPDGKPWIRSKYRIGAYCNTFSVTWKLGKKLKKLYGSSREVRSTIDSQTMAKNTPDKEHKLQAQSRRRKNHADDYNDD